MHVCEIWDKNGNTVYSVVREEYDVSLNFDQSY